jgi:hypothetical protein
MGLTKGCARKRTSSGVLMAHKNYPSVPMKKSYIILKNQVN